MITVSSMEIPKYAEMLNKRSTVILDYRA